MRKEEKDNTNKIKEKKNDSEVSIRKDDIQHKNEGSFQEFWESERKEEEQDKRIHW